MASFADTIAQHVVLSLICLIVLALAMTVIAWRAIEHLGPKLWDSASRVWSRLSASPPAERVARWPGVRHALVHTLTVGRYLGMHAVISFLIAFAAMAAFFELADEIGIDESLAQFDELLRSAMAAHTSETMLAAMATASFLGDKLFLLPLAALITIVLLVTRHRLLAFAWAFGTALGALLNRLLKAIFERSRPVHAHEFVDVDGWSFPSGHASGAMLVYGLLAYILIRHTDRAWHIPIALVSITLIVLVGFSRVILQVHYLSDVLAGYASGGAWSALCIAGYEGLRRNALRSAGARAQPQI